MSAADVLAWAMRVQGHDEAHANRALYLARAAIIEAVDEAVGARLPTLLVKGAGLALTAYASPWSRPMTDVDLLAPPDRVHELARVLVARGFRPLDDPSRPRSTALLERVLLPPEPLPPIPVELHASLDKVAPRALAFAPLWERGVPHGDGLMRAPSLEDHLLLVAIHLANDEFDHALGIADVAALVSAGADLALAASRAEACGARTALSLALEAARARRGEDAGMASPRGLRAHLARRLFDPRAWPIGRTRVALGWRWIAKQALLRDDTATFARGVLRYAALRAIERARPGR